jgi:hypothetical protein
MAAERVSSPASLCAPMLTSVPPICVGRLRAETSERREAHRLGQRGKDGRHGDIRFDCIGLVRCAAQAPPAGSGADSGRARDASWA